MLAHKGKVVFGQAEGGFEFAANGKGAGRIGNASGNEQGTAPELNYEDRVLLWLKRNGAYPREAYRFRQEGVVMLRFIVERSGEIRQLELVFGRRELFSA